MSFATSEHGAQISPWITEAARPRRSRLGAAGVHEPSADRAGYDHARRLVTPDLRLGARATDIGRQRGPRVLDKGQSD